MTAGNAWFYLTCMGRFHETFDSKFGAYFCDEIEHGSSKWLLCKSGTWMLILPCSNVPEAFLLWRSTMLIKAQTNRVKETLSINALETRRR